ncbi:hypothetical protein V8C44DRAFT_296481 [Trichoderma aethiopicum]
MHLNEVIIRLHESAQLASMPCRRAWHPRRAGQHGSAVNVALPGWPCQSTISVELGHRDALALAGLPCRRLALKGSEETHGLFIHRCRCRCRCRCRGSAEVAATLAGVGSTWLDARIKGTCQMAGCPQRWHRQRPVGGLAEMVSWVPYPDYLATGYFPGARKKNRLRLISLPWARTSAANESHPCPSVPTAPPLDGLSGAEIPDWAKRQEQASDWAAEMGSGAVTSIRGVLRSGATL